MDQVNQFIHKSSTIEQILAFANGNTRLLVIQLVQTLKDCYLQIVDFEALAYPINQCCIFLNKLSGSLLIETKLVSQITTITLTDQDLVKFVELDDSKESSQSINPVAIVRSYLQSTLNPLFNTIKRNDYGDEGEFAFSKYIADLDTALVQYEQNLEIPNAQIVFPPFLIEAADKCRAAGSFLSSSELGWDEVPSKELEDKLKSLVNQWSNNIQRLTEHSRDIKQGTVLQEVNYWIVLQNALQEVLQKMEMYEAQLLFRQLQLNNRFLIVNLNSKLEKTESNCRFLKEISIQMNAIMTCSDLSTICGCIGKIFNQLKKYEKYRSYPTTRLNDLVKCIARDINRQCTAFLESEYVLDYSYNDFVELNTVIKRISKNWDFEITQLWEALTPIRKAEKVFFDYNMLTLLEDLIESMKIIHQFRDMHENYLNGIVNIFSNQDRDAIVQQMRIAYEPFRNFIVADMSEANSHHWKVLTIEYNKSMEQVDDIVIKFIDNKLGQVHSTEQLFFFFNKYKSLFMRPHIQSAFQHYQNTLIDQCKKDVMLLKDMVSTTTYRTSEAHRLSVLYDIPELAGMIIWTKQIEKRLNVYNSRMEMLLGEQWESHSEGKAIKTMSNSIRNRLVLTDKIEQWKERVLQVVSSQPMSNTIFSIQHQPTTGYSIVLNYNPEYSKLYKEIRSNSWITPDLNKYIPVEIRYKPQEFKDYYSRATTLNSTLLTYNGLLQQTDASILNLTAKYHQAVRDLIVSSIQDNLTWKRKELPTFISNFTKAVFEFQEKIITVTKFVNELNRLKQELLRCAYTSEDFSLLINRIQAVSNELCSLNCNNLESFFATLDADLSAILVERCNAAIQSWIVGFNRKLREEVADVMEEADLIAEECSTVRDVNIYQSVLQINCVHSVRIAHKNLVMYPPIAESKKCWIDSLLSVINTVTSLPRVHCLDGVFSSESATNTTYFSLTSMINQTPVIESVLRIETMMKRVNEFVYTWLKNQGIMKLSVKDISDSIQPNILSWIQLLESFFASKNELEMDNSEVCIDCIHISLEEIQASIHTRYNSLGEELLSSFASLVQSESQEFITELNNDRSQLERFTVNGSISDAINTILICSRIESKLLSLQHQKEILLSGEDLLQKRLFVFPSTWVYSQQIEDDWDCLNQILKRRKESITLAHDRLQKSVRDEDEKIMKKINDKKKQWDAKKPQEGTIPVDEALHILSEFESEFTHLREKQEHINESKLAVSIAVQNDTSIELALRELNGLKDAWNSVQVFWKRLTELGEIRWSALVPKTLNHQYNLLERDIETLPYNVKQYDCYIHLKKILSDYKRDFKILQELKNSILKEHHWAQIFNILNISASTENLRVCDFWIPAFNKEKEKILEVKNTAQEELNIEDLLKGIKEYWSHTSLELVSYQQRCKLIRGWEQLFTKLDEDINNLAGVKQTAYFKIFAEETTSWEDKVIRMRVLFDTWIDVQRRWVYLEGIFLGGNDIIQQLPQDYSRFKTIDTEFVSLMRKVAAQPLILDVFNTPNLQRTLERLSQQLTKIQKSLGEFLEKQRQAFSRFYFVGDEDLLEIIGNSNDPVKVQRHLNKMFAGINSIEFEPNGPNFNLKAMVSKEGEVVPFSNPVLLTPESSVVSWLTQVEEVMRQTLALSLQSSLSVLLHMNINSPEFIDWIRQYPSQIIILSIQIYWCKRVEDALRSTSSSSLLTETSQLIDSLLKQLAERVLHPMPQDERKKVEQLITEFVYEKSTTLTLLEEGVRDVNDFKWQYRLRAYYDENEPDLLKRLRICIADGMFFYGYEYLGVCERLVQTPLTDRCYLTLSQALCMGLGGNPFGPAGTGKTESVKMLASLLGRFCLVFNCDESFDFQAMGRIFRGLCQVGAWGCFDEFNRLEERILSAVSQQIWTIQTGLRDQKKQIYLLDKPVNLHPNVGIFVTMNPGYAGRSNLPDNLKQLFRGIAMIQPDWEKIAQVMLFSQGFSASEVLAGKMVLLFTLCQDQLSSQAHYDFGLRALKSVVVSAGNLKRIKYEQNEKELLSMNYQQQEEFERDVLLSSVCDTLIPKLVADDLPLLQSLLSGVFTGATIKQIEAIELRSMIKQVCAEHKLCATDAFIEKTLQLYLVQDIRHGIMLVGPSGSGKSSVIQCLIEAMERVDGQQGVVYIIDPKAISKEQLFGSLDTTTNEWNDGIFTYIIRQIYNDVRGESNRRHWIVFDGDVDPEWAENLNSVLDDNKLLTLPTGDRLSLPKNVRILFEVENLKYATPASVSRCGTVWFSQDTVTVHDMLSHSLSKLRSTPLIFDMDSDRVLELQNTISDILSPFYDSHCLIEQCVSWSLQHTHIMDVTTTQLIGSFDSLIQQVVIDIFDYNMDHLEEPMSEEHLLMFVTNRMIESIIWGIGGSLMGNDRLEFCEMIQSITSLNLPTKESLIDFSVDIRSGCWRLWKQCVPHIEIDSKHIIDTSVVIPTVDTIRNQHIMRSFLTTRKPVILCGPPGSGKTMTLTDTLKTMNGFDVVSVNFSSTTQPSLIMKIFDQYGSYQKVPNGKILQPKSPDKWLIIFCDEVNLPEEDKYGTQRVISFLRQLVEQQGFWDTKEHVWIQIKNIQFVAACNPPTDPGRIPLSLRFLSHVPVLFVDYPEQQSLIQIYSTFNKALVQNKPSICNCYEQLTEAMVSFYEQNKQQFSLDQQPQYVYSPRELTRWMRALDSAFTTYGDLTPSELVRLAAHEALRLFCDRLVTNEEKQWCQHTLNEVMIRVFNVFPSVLQGPILFSSWLHGCYESVSKEDLLQYLEMKLHEFNEEELNVPLVLFDDVLEHVIRIDRVLKQPLGHLLLVGESGAGKTVLTRFVAWMEGMNVFQIKISRRYSLENFDDDLRTVMRQAGVEGKQTCFIFDESNILSTGFLERMNALLASGEVPGLYEGDDMMSLMSACREATLHEGLVMDSNEEMFRWFTSRVQRNLHVVFTMNPANGEFRDRAATSPALFNRCVVDWFGSWGRDALLQVSQFFTRSLNIDITQFTPSEEAIMEVCKSWGVEEVPANKQITLHDSVNAAILSIHQSVVSLDEEKTSDTRCYCSPRDYLDFINHYLSLFQRKQEELEGQQRHLRVGLERLQETSEEVRILGEQIAQKRIELDAASTAANVKLNQIVENKELATKNAETSKQLAEELKSRYAEITEKKARADKELDSVEPLLKEAQNSVKQINKAQLNEIRTMVNPPKNVQLTIKAVCCLLGEDCKTWQNIQKVIRKDDFISNIINFNTSRVTSKSSNDVSGILKTPDFTYESANRSSKACGPLYKWVASQLQYSNIIQRVKPLRDEVELLTARSNEMREMYEDCVAELKNLDMAIENYSKEYQDLTNRCQKLSEEIQIVTQKSERSAKLLESLQTEQHRWKESSNMFLKELTSMIGDCLLGASFMTYAGFFDQHHRSLLLEQWKGLLYILCIPYNPHFEATGYLSSSKDRLVWQSNGLPADELCVQNAIMLNRFNRYPLLVDPSGQGTSYLMNMYSSNRVVKTSFLDKSFMKQLESALRFGSILIVQDVENADPILNPLLNKEFHKEDGRLLIRLGDQDVNFSPSFKLFLSTRDSSYQFPPDLCSRVTFVNFTMTVSSLQDQCLSIILQKEAPELYKKRNDLLQLQGEYQARLRDLEEQLLLSLNNLQGNILDNDTVMNNLEYLKTEAQSISHEISQANDIMSSIHKSSCIYQPLSQACSQIYFILDSLHHIFFLYRYNLQFFLDILHTILLTPLEANLTPSQRMSALLQLLYRCVYARVSRGLKHLDSRILALRLCQLYVQGTPNEPEYDEFQLLLKGSLVNINESTEEFIAAVFNDILTEEQEKMVMMHLSLDHTTNLKKSFIQQNDYWSNDFMRGTLEELTTVIDHIGEINWSHGKCLWRWLLLIKELRPELLISAIEYVVTELCDNAFFEGDTYDLRQVVKSESKSDTPLLLCSAPGYDASKKIEQLYMENDLQLDTMAMGNSDSFAEAEKLISIASAKGTAVLLRNVHLCPEWLSSLEKFFFTLHPHSDFRLFMTSEISDKLPPSLLRISYTLVFETPTGIRASLKHSLNMIPEDVMNVRPVERCRIYFLLIWLHAVVEERLRYVPVGWTKSYEFSEADLKCSLTMINRWVEVASHGLPHMDIDMFNWKAVRTLLSQSLYGGRIDNVFDDELLSGLINHLFVSQSFDSQFPLVQCSLPNGEKQTLLVAPEGTCKRDFEEWVDTKVPVYNSPVWLGLPATAEERLLSSQGSYILHNLLLIQDSIDVDHMAVDLTKGDVVPSSWMTSLAISVEKWLSLLMIEIHPLPTNERNLQNHLFRFFNREIQAVRYLQNMVVEDLKFILGVCQGKMKSTHQIRILMKLLNQDRIPETWSSYYKSPQDQICSLWMEDFIKRCQHFSVLSTLSIQDLRVAGVWLGGLFHPEAYITAMRQVVAQENGWALENVKLKIVPLTLEEFEQKDALLRQRTNAYLIHGLILEGAEWRDSQLLPSDQIRFSLDEVLFEWESASENDKSMIKVPIYLNEGRADLLYVVEMKHMNTIPSEMWNQRAVSIIAWRHS